MAALKSPGCGCAFAPVFGAAERSVSGDSTEPIGVSVNIGAFVTFRLHCILERQYATHFEVATTTLRMNTIHRIERTVECRPLLSRLAAAKARRIRKRQNSNDLVRKAVGWIRVFGSNAVFMMCACGKPK